MSLNLQLLSNTLSSIVRERLDLIEINPDEIVQTATLSALSEIQAVIKNDALSDFDALEEIVCIFEKYNIDFGARHDF